MDCEKCRRRECEEYLMRRVKLGYIADSPTSVQLVDSIGNQVFDLLPVIQAGETDTSIELLSDIRRIRYYPEKWTRTEGTDGCYYDICIPDIAALIDLNELRNIDTPETLSTGDTIIYNATTQKYEMFNLTTALAGIDGNIGYVNDLVTALTSRVTTLENKILEQNQKIAQLNEIAGALSLALQALTDRVSAVEGAIYDWDTDKTTKIPRGNINITSGGYNSGNGIYTRAVDTNEDLNFN